MVSRVGFDLLSAQQTLLCMKLHCAIQRELFRRADEPETFARKFSVRRPNYTPRKHRARIFLHAAISLKFLKLPVRQEILRGSVL
jgi:hypothetical protein